MNRDELLKYIFNLLSKIAIWIILIAIAIFLYFWFNQALYEKIFKFVMPVFVYSLGLVFMIYFRKRKKDIQVRGGSEISTTIYITQWDLSKHDLIMFSTPLVMLIMTKVFKKEVGGFDILLSGVAFVGLYISELIYKQKMK